MTDKTHMLGHLITLYRIYILSGTPLASPANGPIESLSLLTLHEERMKNGLGRQFESLIRRRFQERDKHFSARLMKVKDEYNRRGLLSSSMTVVTMHDELEREFKESAAECVKALADAMENRATVLLVPRMRKVLRLYSHALSERKADLDAAFQGASASIVASLLNNAMIAPYRSLSDSFVQLQCQNACVELRTKQRELFWLKLRRLRLVLALVAAVAAAAGAFCLERAEIAQLWESLRDSVEKPTHDAGESMERTTRPVVHDLDED